MNRKRILLDVDDVLIDTVTAWLTLYNQLFEDTLRIDQVDTWEMLPLVKSEAKRVFSRLLELPEVYRYARPLPHALYGYQQLVNQGHQVIFCTSSYFPQKVEWLARHNLLTGENLIITPDKTWIDADLLIDDRGSSCLAYPGKAIVFDRPWNRGLKYMALPRAYGWMGLLNLVDHIANDQPDVTVKVENNDR